MNRNKKKTRGFYGELFALMIPIAFQSMMTALVSVSDAIMLGRIDQDSIAGVSLATQIHFVMMLFLGTVVGGVTVLASQYWGKQDKSTVTKLFAMSLRYNFVITLVFFGAAFFFPELLMRLYASDPELIRIGASYLRIVSWSYLFIGLSQCYLGFMKITGRAAYSALVGSTVVVLNIILNAVFIYGLFGAPRMEARGTAVATVIVCVLEFVWVVLATHRKDRIHPAVEDFRGFPRVLRQDFFGVSRPLLAASLVWGIGFTMYSMIMGHLGSDAAAANSIATVVKDLLSCLCNGLGIGARIIIGRELGQNRIEEARRDGARMAKVALICGGVSAVLVLAVSPIVLSFVVLSDTARGYLTKMLLICAVYMFAKAPNVIVTCGVFFAGGDTKYDAISTFYSMWLFSIPLGLLGAFVFHWPVMLVYLIVSADEIIKTPFIYPRYRKYIWLQNLTRE